MIPKLLVLTQIRTAGQSKPGQVNVTFCFILAYYQRLASEGEYRRNGMGNIMDIPAAKTLGLTVAGNFKYRKRCTKAASMKKRK